MKKRSYRNYHLDALVLAALIFSGCSTSTDSTASSSSASASSDTEEVSEVTEVSEEGLAAATIALSPDYTEVSLGDTVEIYVDMSVNKNGKSQADPADFSGLTINLDGLSDEGIIEDGILKTTARHTGTFSVSVSYTYEDENYLSNVVKVTVTEPSSANPGSEIEADEDTGDDASYVDAGTPTEELYTSDISVDTVIANADEIIASLQAVTVDGTLAVLNNELVLWNEDESEYIVLNEETLDADPGEIAVHGTLERNGGQLILIVESYESK